MHRRHRRRAGCQWDVDVEAVEDVAGKIRQRAQHGPQRTAARRAPHCGDPRRQFGDHVTLNDGGQCRGVQLSGQCVQEFTDIGLDAAAVGPKGERAEPDFCCVAAHPTTPKKSQK